MDELKTSKNNCMPMKVSFSNSQPMGLCPRGKSETLLWLFGGLFKGCSAAGPPVLGSWRCHLLERKLRALALWKCLFGHSWMCG